MLKMIVWDMDGTMNRFYAVKDWLKMLREEKVAPYLLAEPMWDMVELAEVLTQFQQRGVEIRVVTWLSKDSSEEYKEAVREAKRDWLKHYNFPCDHFHGVAYGATKADSVRKYLNKDETAILIDDNAKVRHGWHLGETIDPHSLRPYRSSEKSARLSGFFRKTS